MRRTFFWMFFLCLTLLGLSAAWLRHVLIAPYFAGANPEIFVDIPHGAGSEKIAKLLEESGVIRNRFAFTAYLRWKDLGKHLKAGEYRFVIRATPIEIATRLVRGDIYLLSLTIPEGFSKMEVAHLMLKHGLGTPEEVEAALRRTDWIRDLDPEATGLEGYLFPETYRFSRHASAEEIVHAMVQQFRDLFHKLVPDGALPPGWTVRGIVTLASMIEKEVMSEDERALVASVLTNRISMRIPLACDPTVIYALKLEGKYDGNIRKGDLKMKSPYNTYLHRGLPPGPVANPGLSSLRAALAPPKTDFLYFVSRNDGTHQFSKDYSAHRHAVARFQKTASR